MRAGTLARQAALLVLALALGACAGTTQTAPANGSVCENLAWVFYLVAQEKERGQSEEKQIAHLQKTLASPMVTNPEAAARQLTRVVSFVYGQDSSPREVKRTVLDGCQAGDEGKAVLNFWKPL